MIKHLSLFIMLLALASCAKNAEERVEVYNNTFESNSLDYITGGTITVFNGSNVLGTYNNGGFLLNLVDLPAHNIVDISFDLYIHDSWEGNQQIQNNTAGPDIWQLLVDKKTYINTTFSNLSCLPGNFCPPQSYPADYPNNNNNPRSGAAEVDLPGYCSEASNVKGTTLYKIHKSINHSGTTLNIECLDKLKQKNVADAKCDESWSIDNLKVNVVNVR